MSKEVILALGGGGARGLAHIGVIRALEAANIRIAAVAGTSIGSVIGGIYCAGQLDKSEEYVRDLSWTGVLSHFDPTLPRSGVFAGKRVEKVLKELSGDPDFSDLDIPFCAVATDLSDGNEIHIKGGNVLKAMRASLAIPGVFNPASINDSWMIDGGIAAPIPINAARELGNAPIVAVNVNSTRIRSSRSIPEKPKEDISGSQGQERHNLWKQMEKFWRQGIKGKYNETMPGIIPIMSDSIAHLQNHLARYQMQVDQPDVIVEPPVGNATLLDFHNAGNLIEKGQKAMEAALAGDAFKPLESRERQ